MGELCILVPNFTKCDPARVLDTFKKYDTTVLSGSPAFIYRLATYATQHHMLLPVKYVGVGGAPVFHGVFRTIASATACKQVVVLYGGTEAEPMTMIMASEKLPLESTQTRGLCVGRPVLDAKMKIIKLLDGMYVGLSH